MGRRPPRFRCLVAMEGDFSLPCTVPNPLGNECSSTESEQQSRLKSKQSGTCLINGLVTKLRAILGLFSTFAHGMGRLDCRRENKQMRRRTVPHRNSLWPRGKANERHKVRYSSNCTSARHHCLGSRLEFRRRMVRSTAVQDQALFTTAIVASDSIGPTAIDQAQ